ICKTSSGRNILFPSIHLPHLHHRFRIAFGLRFVMQPHPPAYALWDSCSSGRKFASGFLQIPPRRGHPCLWLCTWRYHPYLGLSPFRKCSYRAHMKQPASLWGKRADFLSLGSTYFTKEAAASYTLSAVIPKYS
ncbi:MAG TPA: hypothetical protein DIC57_05755, partial [Sphaerochaeta sp.]|nr:hypothetical protein [Sphaerochaeta sp.]